MAAYERKELEAYTVKELREMLKANGLDEKGDITAKKNELIERLLNNTPDKDVSDNPDVSESDTMPECVVTPKDIVTVKVIDTYKDTKRNCTQHIGDIFDANEERAHQLVAAGVAMIV